MNKEISYLEVATMAARLEIDGSYARAAQLWDAARNLAKSTMNKAWCQTRAELCERKREDTPSPQ